MKISLMALGFACLAAAILAAQGASSVVRAENMPGNQRIVVDPTIDPYVSRNGLSGKLSVAGSDTMSGLMTKLAAQFIMLHPGVQIAVENVGSNAAIREFQLGMSSQRRGDKARGVGTAGSNQVGLLASSRELTEEEKKGFEKNYGYRPVGIPIALDAVAIYVHRDNPITGLTLEQVDGVFGKERERGHPSIDTWRQAGITDGPLADAPIHLYGRDRRSATRAFLSQIVLKGGELKEEVREKPGSASEIIAVAQDPLSIGYAGVGFQIPSVRVVPIATNAREPGIVPTHESVLSGIYPLRRSLYLYVKADPAQNLAPLVREFMLFVNSRQGQETVARAALFPVAGSQVRDNRARLHLDETALAEVANR